MSVSELVASVEKGDYARFEALCLEQMDGSALRYDELAAAFDLLSRRNEAKRVEVLAQMVLDARRCDVSTREMRPFLAAALKGSPDSAELRAAAIEHYRALYGNVPGFDDLLRVSGLASGRAARAAMRTMDVCLAARVGAYMVGRADDTPYQVVDADLEGGQFRLKGATRTVTVPATELAAAYEPVDSDDFRVLRRLHPERLAAMAADEPERLAIALIHAHGDLVDVDVLREELVPTVVSESDWSRWWTRTRAALKRHPNVQIEGRSPTVLKYTAKEITLESETLHALARGSEPVKWLAALEGYLREKQARKEPVHADVVKRADVLLAAEIDTLRAKRPADALAAALVAERLAGKGLALAASTRAAATELLREARDPIALLRRIDSTSLWEQALALLPGARPEWPRLAVELLRHAPEALLNDLVKAAVDAHAPELQRALDAALSDPLHHPEIISWLWKGPRIAMSLSVPTPRELLARILGTLSSLGRAVDASAEVMKAFRAKMKSALSHREYARFRECLEQTDEAMAVTIRRHLERMEGLGDNAPSDMLRILRETHPRLWVAKRLEPWEDPDVLWTTSAGYQRKKDEIDELVNVKMRENAKAIGRAAEFGDLSENAEYKFALEERDLLRARLAQLNDEMSRARILEPGDAPTDHVGVGSSVRLIDAADGAQRLMTFFGPWDADVERGLFNYNAPVSQKLMGARVGDQVSLAVDGQERVFVVKEIRNGFEMLAGSGADATV